MRGLLPFTQLYEPYLLPTRGTININDQDNDDSIIIKKAELIDSDVNVFFYSKKKLADFSNIAGVTERLKDLTVSAWDVTMLTDKSNYTSSIYRLENSNWVEISLELKTFPNSVNYIIRDITSETQRLVGRIHGRESIPLSLILLRRSKNILDTRDRLISIITVYEVGVKELYQQEKLGLTLIFGNLQSPSVDRLLGSMFKGYFNIEFPKEIRKKIKNFIKKHNKLACSSQGSKSAVEECFECYMAALKTFSFFYKINGSFMCRNFYEGSIELTPAEPNKSQIALSKGLEREIESQGLAIGVSITDVSTYKGLHEAKP